MGLSVKNILFNVIPKLLNRQTVEKEVFSEVFCPILSCLAGFSSVSLELK